MFGYQGIGGVSYALSEQWSVAAEYRYFATLEAAMDSEANGAGAGILTVNHAR